MPAKPKAEPHHASQVERLLHQHDAKHLRARCYGSTVIVESGPKDDPVKHFRLRRESVHLWCLDFAGRGDRWEHTPVRTNVADIVSAVVEEFPWTLTEIA